LDRFFGEEMIHDGISMCEVEVSVQQKGIRVKGIRLETPGQFVLQYKRGVAFFRQGGG
jgi:hypothetical protein